MDSRQTNRANRASRVTGAKRPKASVSRAAAEAQPPSRLFRLGVYGLVLASSGTQFAVVPIMPAYAHRFGLTGVQQGMVLGATGLATLAVCLPAGAASDRFGARRLTLAAGLLMTVALIGQAAAGGFAMLLLSRLAFGIGFAVIWTAGLSWLAGAVPGRPGLGGSVVSAGAGGVLGPALSGTGVQYFGLAAPFLAAAAGFALITAALALPWTPASPPAPAARAAAGLLAVACDPAAIVAAAAIVTAGVTTGVSALLVPGQLHAGGASTGRIGVVFSVAGVLFVAGSTLTAALGRRAVRLPVVFGGMLALALVQLPAALTFAAPALVAMLYATTAARSVLWTVSYPLAAGAAQRGGAGLGVVMGFLNGVWAATSLLAPLAAGHAEEHFSRQTVFGLTGVLCIAVLAVTVLATRRPVVPPPQRSGRKPAQRPGVQPAPALSRRPLGAESQVAPTVTAGGNDWEPGP